MQCNSTTLTRRFNTKRRLKYVRAYENGQRLTVKEAVRPPKRSALVGTTHDGAVVRERMYSEGDVPASGCCELPVAAVGSVYDRPPPSWRVLDGTMVADRCMSALGLARGDTCPLVLAPRGMTLTDWTRGTLRACAPLLPLPPPRVAPVPAVTLLTRLCSPEEEEKSSASGSARAGRGPVGMR